MTEQSSYYIIIPAPVKCSKDISANAKLLFGEIAVKCNVRGYCWASNSYFAEVLGCDIRSVQRYIKELETAKFVAVELSDDAEKGTIRKITATVLSQHPTTILSPLPATDLSPDGMTNLSPPPMTKPSLPDDNGGTDPDDKADTHINNTILKEDDNKKENNNSAAVNNNLFGEQVPWKVDKGAKRKEKGAPREIVMPFESFEFSQAWNNWKEYKAGEFLFKYKTPQSEQAALIELANLANGGGEKAAIEIINQSMAKGWKGFFALKTENNANNGFENNGRNGNSTTSGANNIASRIIAANEKFGR